MNMKSVLRGFLPNQMTQSAVHVHPPHKRQELVSPERIQMKSTRVKTKHSGVEGDHLYWEELLNWIRRGFSFWTRILMMLMNNKKLTCWQRWMDLEVRREDRPPAEHGPHHSQLWMQRWDP